MEEEKNSGLGKIYFGPGLVLWHNIIRNSGRFLSSIILVLAFHYQGHFTCGMAADAHQVLSCSLDWAKKGARDGVLTSS